MEVKEKETTDRERGIYKGGQTEQGTSKVRGGRKRREDEK